MPDYPKFDQAEIDNVLKAAAQHYDYQQLRAIGSNALIDSGHVVYVSATCVSVAVDNGKVCLELPFKLGNICLPIPHSVPNGTAVQACLSVCTTLGFPTGIEVTVSILGKVILKRSWGKC